LFIKIFKEKIESKIEIFLFNLLHEKIFEIRSLYLFKKKTLNEVLNAYISASY